MSDARNAAVYRMAQYLYGQYGKPARDFQYLSRREQGQWFTEAVVALAVANGHEKVGAGFAEAGMRVEVWAADGNSYEEARANFDANRAEFHCGTIDTLVEDRPSEDVYITFAGGKQLATKSYAACYIKARPWRTEKLTRTRK